MEKLKFIDKIGFSEDEKQKLFKAWDKYACIISDYRIKYENDEMEISDIQSALDDIHSADAPKQLLYLLFVISSLDYFYDKCKTKKLGQDIFNGTLQDIKCKKNEFFALSNEIGLKSPTWFNNFFKRGYVTLGRLQFAPEINSLSEIKASGITIENGDFVCRCHIPSFGSLRHDLCLDSYKKAYKFFSDKLKGGILPIVCGTWFLYPPYYDVFGAKSNIIPFASDFEIASIEKQEIFQDAWRIFSMDFNGETKALPHKTTMQRNFIKYIENGKSFGKGHGILLFDGKNILTKNQYINVI